MIEKLQFSKPGSYKGQNGVGHMIGLELMGTNGGKTVMLSPVNSMQVTGSCWIEIPVEEIGDVINKLRSYCTDQIFPGWHISDVQSVRRDLTDEQAMNVLRRVDSKSDASIGINWDVIRYYADDTYPNPDYNEDDYEDV